VADTRQEAIMRNVVNAVVLSLACALTLAPHTASAQTTPPPASPPVSQPSSLITYRGLETGFDVTTGREGEAAFYIGASSTRGSLAVRFSKMDAGASVPCSAGVMYEYLFGRNRARITPVAGASVARVFSCGDESDGITTEPSAHSVSEFSGGVRLPMFVGHHVVGSLKVVAFAQRQFGSESASDVTSKGVRVGLVVGRR
jgi:hypothetical protein